MKRIAKFASVGIIATSLFVFFLPSTAVAAPKKSSSSASTTLKGSLPNGKPFQYLNSRINALQAQIDLLIGRVSSLEEWQIKAQAALDQLRLDVDKNAILIGLLQAQIDDINDILETKQNIISGECPAGQYVYSILADGSLVCRADVGAKGLAVLTVEKVADVAAGATADVLAECPVGTPAGGSYNAAPDLVVNSAGIVANGYNVNATNLTGAALPVSVTATCMAIIP